MMKLKRMLPGLLALACGLVMVNGVRLSVLAQQGEFTIERVSVASDGTEGNDASFFSAISGAGRYVVFSSSASNLVPDDTNICDYGAPLRCPDIFVHDRETGQTTRVSVASDGTQGNDWSAYSVPAISADGRLVVFGSVATNLVPGDTNAELDTFVHDRETGETTRVSVASDGTQANASSYSPAISADGRFVAFASSADNLVSNDSNNDYDEFVHDRQTGQTALVSIASDGTQADGSSGGWSISADGSFVVFGSDAANLVAGDTNAHSDIFVHERQSQQTTRVSVASDGSQANGDSYEGVISADGRFIAFSSAATNLVLPDTNGYTDIFLHDRQTGETTRISVTSDGSQFNGSEMPSISADGRFIAFMARADNISGCSSGGRNIFVYDRQMDEMICVSTAADGTPANHNSSNPVISADGRYVTFSSDASNLVPGDTNNQSDIFVVHLPFVPDEPTPEITPDAPNAIPHRTVFTTHTPTLTWNRLSWATRYDIQIATTTNFSTSLVYEGSTTGPELEHLVTQTLDDGLYYWRVRGVRASGAGNWSAADEFVVDAD